MAKNLGAIPTPRRIRTLSNPQLVAAIRRFAKDQVVYKLQNAGQESPIANLYREAMAEAARRQLTIKPPELVDEPPECPSDPPEGC